MVGRVGRCCEESVEFFRARSRRFKTFGGDVVSLAHVRKLLRRRRALHCQYCL